MPSDGGAPLPRARTEREFPNRQQDFRNRARQPAIWKRGLTWARTHPDEDPGLWDDMGHKAVVRAFEAHTGGEYHCRYICGRSFRTVEAHAEFLDEGGCEALLAALASA